MQCTAHTYVCDNTADKNDSNAKQSHQRQPNEKEEEKKRLSLHLNFMKLIYSLIKCELFKKIQTDS